MLNIMSRRGRAPARNSTKQEPVFLGQFNQLSLRVLRGKLKQTHEIIGLKDTAQLSRGGYGGGRYNAWFKVELMQPAWIILTKGPPRPNYVQLSVYDCNGNPQEGRMIFEAVPPRQETDFDFGRVLGTQPVRSQTQAQLDARKYFGLRVNPETNQFNFYPFFGTVSAANADLYNNFDARRLDGGNDMYFPLPVGRYLICISSTRNEPLDYEVGLVIEPQDDEVFLICEDDLVVEIGLEDKLDKGDLIEIKSPVTEDITVPSGVNAFTPIICSIEGNPLATVDVEFGATWLISTSGGQVIPSGSILGEFTSGWLDTFHDHSQSQWTAAYQRDHRANDPLPPVFVPLLNRR